MATYITLANFTDKGLANAKDTVTRADAVRELARKFGVTIKDIYWTQGEYDLVTLFESSDEASITALALAIGAAGNVRGRTMRAMNRDEMRAAVNKLGQVREAMPA